MEILKGNTCFCSFLSREPTNITFAHRFLTGAMSHEDAAKVQVGFGRCVYHWPVFAGDTIKKSYKVERVRNTSDGNHSVSLIFGLD
jgi:hypothetical protein